MNYEEMKNIVLEQSAKDMMCDKNDFLKNIFHIFSLFFFKILSFIPLSIALKRRKRRFDSHKTSFSIVRVNFIFLFILG